MKEVEIVQKLHLIKGQTLNEFIIKIGFYIYQVDNFQGTKKRCTSKHAKMDIQRFLQEWLMASNNYDTENYITFYDKEAVLEDVTLGETFSGHNGIIRYFKIHFIGYGTQTAIRSINTIDSSHVKIDAVFDGDSFQGLEGVFDLNFENGKIKMAKCYLV
jgi:hypothetical protein